MKKIVLVILVVAAATYAKAQTSIGIQAGASFAAIQTDFMGDKHVSTTKVGLTAGVVGNMQLSDNFAVRPALNYVSKGGKDKEAGETSKLNLNYVELPVDFVYNTTPQNGKFFIGVGPVLSCGISGTSKSSVNGAEDINIKFGNEDGDTYKRFELGANAIAGFQLNNGFFVSGEYNLGLSNLGTGGDDKFHNRYYALKVGYMFSKMMKKKS